MYIIRPYTPVERRIYYYDRVIDRLAIETHRINWSRNTEDNICATADEQIQPPFSHNAVPLFDSVDIALCLFRRGNLYIDLRQDSDASIATAAADTEVAAADAGIDVDPIQVLRRALRTNHHFIRRIHISVDGLPYRQ